MLISIHIQRGSKDEASGLRGAIWQPALNLDSEKPLTQNPNMIFHQKRAVNQCNKPCLNIMWQLHFRRVPRDAPIASLKSTRISLQSLSQTNTKIYFDYCYYYYY